MWSASSCENRSLDGEVYGEWRRGERIRAGGGCIHYDGIGSSRRSGIFLDASAGAAARTHAQTGDAENHDQAEQPRPASTRS